MSNNIAYRFETPFYPGDILYVNTIARYSCINDCLFCSRPRQEEDYGKSNIYEQKAGTSLFLPQVPSLDQVITAIDSKIRPDDKELAIIGLGEPLLNLPLVTGVLRYAKSKYGIKTRIDTNGLVGCMYGDQNPAVLLEKAGLDEIRISLNAINEKEYNALCKPKVDEAFPNLIKFIKGCVQQGIDTYVSFVVGYKGQNVSTRPADEYIAFAKLIGIKEDHVIIREWVPAIK